MNRGLVYLWTPDRRESLGGRVQRAIVPLEDLMPGPDGRPRLSGRLVSVRNGGWLSAPADGAGEARAVPIGDAEPDEGGDFLFDPGRGGGRMDNKATRPTPAFCRRYVQASHFGEVNTYYHLHRVATYAQDLLDELDAPRLPRVIAVVNAHHAATDQEGIRDGEHGGDRWKAFQGGHYRLPGRRFHIDELQPVAETGEIHLGPGRQLLRDGALVRAFGGYRANASHNAGIIYHEYGHHIARHTADFRGNARKLPQHQNNRKAAIDEGTCDYWAAAMLETPHIWAWHRPHDPEVHPRSLASRKTMDDFEGSSSADPHANGTIWAAALWDLRTELERGKPGGARKGDLLVMKTLLLIGELEAETVRELRRMRADYSTALAALMAADGILHSGRHQALIREIFSKRKIALPAGRAPKLGGGHPPGRPAPLLKHVAADEIPGDADICSAQELEAYLRERGAPPLSVLTVGDIMLGERTRAVIRESGSDHPFAGVLPLLRRSEIVFGNLEGPLARDAEKVDRNFSYRVHPEVAKALARANVRVVTLANNHLTDCGREGVLETLEALEAAGVAAVGAAANAQAAHRPVILQAGSWRVGLLGYYWNRRTAATRDLPGSAMDTADDLRADIAALRGQVDRIVVEFHWGVPYERTPLAEDREKARLAIACGADAVVGHHPHVIQPFEIHGQCPIFYSVGNFTFGSGNSRAEGLMVGFRFGPNETEVEVYPLYVKNRDPRVRYQPKVLRGEAGARVLGSLAEMSGAHGAALVAGPLGATLRLPRRAPGSGAHE